MDKKSLIAMLFIAVILILMPYYNEYILGVKPQEETQQQGAVDTTAVTDTVISEVTQPESELPVADEDIRQREVINDSLKRIIVINTENYSAEFSNIGGGSLKNFILNDYIKYDSTQVNMISEQLQNGITVSFQDVSGKYISLENFVFNVSEERKEVEIRPGEKYVLKYSYNYNGSIIEKTFIFYGDTYHFDFVVSFSDPDEVLLNRQYQVNWVNGLPSTETYLADDNEYKLAIAYMADELVDFKVSEAGETERQSLSGTAEWIALRTKYFISSISNKNANVSEGVYFEGFGIEFPDFIKRIYNAGYYVNYEGKPDSFMVYIGPLDHRQLGQYSNHLDEMIMNNGWYERLFRPISLLILPVLEFLYSFIPNYGIVIIIFSIIIKLVLYPLTKKSYHSMKKMQVVQPKMTELREKYKGDPQRLNKEMMKMYQEYGVNPLGGCLPMLLQMPLLIALFIVFRSTIQLRGAGFIPGWIPDLSQTDTLFTLPFSLPFYGNEFNLLPVLMALTMFFQTKMTMQDPKQKAIAYIMPIFMLAIFNRFPAGLNLYYTMFNLLTIIQQKFIHVDAEKKESVGKKGLPPGKTNKKTGNRKK